MGQSMKYYKILERLTECSEEALKDGGSQYVAVLTSEEWKKREAAFDMLIDLDQDFAERNETKALVNYDSLTGTVSVPDRQHISDVRHCFAFALDEKGIVIIDDEGYAASLVQKIRNTKKWQLPGLERFLYDLLENIISEDIHILESMEHQLNQLEDQIIRNEEETYPMDLNDLRGDLLDLRMHYEQLIDLGHELEENENGFFRTENLRYFRLFTERVSRLQDSVTSLRDYVVQLRDLIHTQLSVRQNKIMTHLTLITSIFMPLTLIAGWYGMNFRYMPELGFRYSYLVVIIISVLIVIFFILWFKKKKWM